MVVTIAVIIVKVAVVMVVAVTVVIIITAAAAMALGKDSKKNPEKSSPRRKERFPSGLPARDGALVGVIGTPINISPA